VQRKFWRLVADGVSTAAACELLGVRGGTGMQWFRDAGGMPPMSLLEPTGRFLTLFEREEIAVGPASGKGIRAIAMLIERSPSTVIRRSPAIAPRPADGGPTGRRWLRPAPRLGRRPQVAKLAANPVLRARVHEYQLTGGQVDRVSRSLDAIATRPRG